MTSSFGRDCGARSAEYRSTEIGVRIRFVIPAEVGIHLTPCGRTLENDLTAETQRTPREEKNLYPDT